MIKQLLSIGVLAAASTLTSQAALTWTGAGNGTSLYAEDNWLDDNGFLPADDTINGATEVTAATGGLIQITGGTGTPASFSPNFYLGTGNSIEVSGGKNLGSSSTYGIQVAAAQGANVNGILSGASTLNVQFTVDIDWTLDGNSIMRLRGGGNPINGGSTINFLDANSTLLFDAETVAEFTSEHLSKILVNGVAAEIGTNINVVSDGGSGSIVTAIVPEPSSAALLGLGGLALLLRRRK